MTTSSPADAPCPPWSPCPTTPANGPGPAGSSRPCAPTRPDGSTRAAPIITYRSPGGTRHVPGHAPGGGYDIETGRNCGSAESWSKTRLTTAACSAVPARKYRAEVARAGWPRRAWT
ncbi:DUF6349 family protein [Nonomuraea antri]|uniref:DUF6349 family protein n=1 Tax=Nonomuraea antri TaxID=2730852 RepID=UPI0038B3414A